MDETWDVIVVGGGAAGLSAALTLGRALRRVVVVDSGQPRNRFAAHMHAVLGNEGTDPAALLERGRAEAAAYGVTFRDGRATGVSAEERTVRVTTTAGELTARALVVASGLTDELPEIPGLAERWGSTVLHCPYCHGWEVRGSRLGVLGASPLSLHQAELVRQWSDRLTFFTAECGDLDPAVVRRLQARGIELVDTPVTALTDGAARLADGREIPLDALFAAPTPRPHDDFLSALELERQDTPMGSFLAVDPTGRTSHPRIWAVGNVANPAANVPISIAAGSMAGAMLNMTLVGEDADDALAEQAADFWEDRYAGSDRVWSGRVNATLADVVAALPAGQGRTVLELGCGEGGDAVWLAEQGWHVTAVDLSPTAVARGAEGAADHGVADRITWVAHNLGTWRTEKTFDLVTASFFHSTVDLPRTEILRRAAGQVRPGGHLLLVSHVFETEEDVPPWARHDASATAHAHDPALLTPDQEIAELALDGWQVERAEIRPREATGPDGVQQATLKDGVVLLRRPA